MNKRSFNQQNEEILRESGKQIAAISPALAPFFSLCCVLYRQLPQTGPISKPFVSVLTMTQCWFYCGSKSWHRPLFVMLISAGEIIKVVM